ncbi:hypothetical protein [Micromonospora sp. WMMD1082]|uniref:hypothetical protein n=1 Tax=Micromonospora sp. WMMD1082 TaxID=3016104 RepID=UPI002416F106|nr:hypothetical protein [Micromonospora sp. WMMD1082]MDG4798781.1 hypothetical protein [Micromonospora sp. WMMD1082]
MSRPTPEPGSARKLVWAPDDVIARLGEEVQPQASLPRRLGQAAITAFVFTWPPAFLVFAASTIAAPSTTNGASVGTTARWAVQFSVLIAITAVAAALWRTARPDAAEPSTRGVTLRVATQLLLTGGCAWLVLALHGLSVGQIAALTVALLVVLHLLPMVVARLLRRRRTRRRAGPPDPAP